MSIYAIRIAVNYFLSVTARLKKGHAVESDSRLHELKRRTEVMPSMAVRGDRKLGAVGCRGASWSEQLDCKELRGALGSARNRENPRFLDIVYQFFFTDYSIVYAGTFNMPTSYQ